MCGMRAQLREKTRQVGRCLPHGIALKGSRLFHLHPRDMPASNKGRHKYSDYGNCSFSACSLPEGGCVGKRAAHRKPSFPPAPLTRDSRSEWPSVSEAGTIAANKASFRTKPDVQRKKEEEGKLGAVAQRPCRTNFRCRCLAAEPPLY